MRKLIVAGVGFTLCWVTAWCVQAAPISQASFDQRPKLVLVVVIDQFRADYLTRFRRRFLPATGAGGVVGGFNYLMSRGAYFPFAQYDILQSATGPGHSTILSGSYPYQTGIPANYWWEAGRGERYCTGDAESAIVGIPADPADLKAPGMSPKNFLGDTVGDELKNAGYSSQVVTVAIKDRAAILMGGHRANLALWFEPNSFGWVSSKYYLPDGKLPAWVQSLNRELTARKGEDYEWSSGASGSGLTLGEGLFKRSTRIGGRESLAFPFGLELTERAAEQALGALHLGRGPATDLLAVSFSSHDYMAHAYGPNTRELEEMTVSEDAQLAKLLNAARRQVPGGLRDVVIALTADHGGPPSPAWLRSVKSGIASDYIYEDKLKAAMEARLTEKYGAPGGKAPWIAFVDALSFYLDPAALADRKVAAADAENEVKAILQKDPGVAYAFTRSEFAANRLPVGMHERQIKKTYFGPRSGDVVGIARPYYMSDGDAVEHQTGYAYDRTVPLILAGSRLRPGVYSEKTEVVDLAPTLSFLLGILPPALSEGRVLSEALTDAAAK